MPTGGHRGIRKATAALGDPPVCWRRQLAKKRVHICESCRVSGRRNAGVVTENIRDWSPLRLGSPQILSQKVTLTPRNGCWEPAQEGREGCSWGDGPEVSGLCARELGGQEQRGGRGGPADPGSRSQDTGSARQISSPPGLSQAVSPTWWLRPRPPHLAQPGSVPHSRCGPPEASPSSPCHLGHPDPSDGATAEKAKQDQVLGRGLIAPRTRTNEW